MGGYLTLVKSVNAKKYSAGRSTQRLASRTDVGDKKPHRRRDESDRSPVRVKGGTARDAALTVGEALDEINTPKTGAAMQAACYLRNEITKENAIRWITCAIMRRRGESFEGWQRHAPKIEAALERCREES
jgi:hypothetical protein